MRGNHMARMIARFSNVAWVERAKRVRRLGRKAQQIIPVGPYGPTYRAGFRFASPRLHLLWHFILVQKDWELRPLRRLCLPLHPPYGHRLHLKMPLR